MAQKGSKTILAYGNGATYDASGSWTNLAKIVSIKPPPIEADDIETSNMDSPNDFKEWVAGWADGGTVSCTIQYEKTQNQALFDLFRDPRGYKIVFPDSTTPGAGSAWKFNGYLKKFGNEVEREKLVTADIDIKVSGEPVFVPAASGA